MPVDFKSIRDANIAKAKKKFDKLAKQARESVKVLETLQKEGLNMAKNLIELPVADKAKKIASGKLAKNMHKVGLATRDEIKELEKKIRELQEEIKTLGNK